MNDLSASVHAVLQEARLHAGLRGDSVVELSDLLAALPEPPQPPGPSKSGGVFEWDE